MLAVSRKRGQSVFVTTPAGERIEFKITRTSEKKATVAIAAPDDWDIRRGELEPLPGNPTDQAA